jgi:hypothetical protein
MADVVTDLPGDTRGDWVGLRCDLAYLRGKLDVVIWMAWMNAAASIAILLILLRH